MAHIPAQKEMSRVLRNNLRVTWKIIFVLRSRCYQFKKHMYYVVAIKPPRFLRRRTCRTLDNMKIWIFKKMKISTSTLTRRWLWQKTALVHTEKWSHRNYSIAGNIHTYIICHGYTSHECTTQCTIYYRIYICIYILYLLY